MRSVQAGLLLTIVFWPLILFLVGWALHHLGHNLSLQSAPPPKASFDVDLSTDFVPPPPATLPDKFVETNPDAPENTPDKTRNFAARNQQVAQEKPQVDGKSDTPQLEGKKDQEVSQIVSGRLQQPQPPPLPAQAAAPEKPATKTNQESRQEQNPLSGEEKIQGDSPEGVGTNLSKATENVTDVQEKVEGQKKAPSLVGVPELAMPQIDPHHPQPRRRVDKNVRPAILAENKFGTSNIGPTAIDAKWSNYGAYLQRLIETVQVEWDRILDSTGARPPAGTVVKVRFRIEATQGAIAEIIESNSTGGTQAERACQLAITARSPYGKWTDDMVAILGQSQEITFTFLYE